MTGWRHGPTRPATAGLLGVFAFYSLTFCALANLTPLSPIYEAVIGRFCIESDLLLALASGLGFAHVLERLGSRGPWRRAVLLGIAGVFALGVAGREMRTDGRSNTVYRDFVTTAFGSLPPSAILMTNMGDDVTGAAFYLHEVEKLRPDVIHLDPSYLGSPWYVARQRRLHRDVLLPDGEYGRHGWNIKQLLEANPDRSIYVVGHMDEWDQSWQDGYRFIPYGLVHALVRANLVPSYESWERRDREALGVYDVAPALHAAEGSWENGLAQRVLDAQVGRAHLALVYGSQRRDNLEMARRARSLLEDVLASSGGDEELGIAAKPGVRQLPTSSELWKNLGLAYQALSVVDEGYVARFAVTCHRFVERADASDPDLPAARKYLERR